MPRQAAKSRVPEVESYLFEILEVEPYYGFHLAYERLEPGAYGEHLHIELLTKCLRPRKFEGRETRFTFMGDRGIIGAIGEMSRGRTVPNGIGTLTMRGDRSEYLGALPYDAAGALPLIVLAGGFRFIYLSGPPTRHGSSRIQSCGFHRHYDPDDL